MSDKKKKVFPPRDPLSTRRPVILKFDKEQPKEHYKEKVEKERTPTILLKAREPSTPKDDRPQSPKHIGTETETIHPKIVQNDNKDKKSFDPKSSPIKRMTKPVKLIDENLDICNDILEYLQDSSINYLVVGIIGGQGVGKSMILNLIAHDKNIQEATMPYILTSHELSEKNTNSDLSHIDEQLDGVKLNEESLRDKVNFKFEMQNIEHIKRGIHCTKGIDIYTADEILYLDCQSLFSASLLDENAGAINPQASRNVNVVTIDCLQITSFLMSVCHVLIAVQDWFTDYNFLRYIQTAEMLKPSISASTANSNQENSESQDEHECYPHLLLLHNRCKLEDYTPSTVNIMQNVYRKVFQKSKLQVHSGMYMYSDKNKNSINVDPVCKNLNLENCGVPLNLFLLPEIYEDYDKTEIYRGHPSFAQLAKRLRWMVLGVNRHQITNVPNLSEKGWFHYCSKAWDTIRKCTFYIEYERFLP